MTIWKLEDGRRIALLTPTELKKLHPDTEICSINGEQRKVHEPEQPPPDDDTRCGVTAWGLLYTKSN